MINPANGTVIVCPVYRIIIEIGKMTSIQPMTKEVSYSDQQLVDGANSSIKTEQRYFQNAFYAKYVGHVYKGAVQKSRNFANPEEVAEELTQDTFTKACKLLSTFKFKKDTPVDEQGFIIKAWLGRISENCFKKIYAKSISVNLIEKNLKETEEVICPLCCEFLLEDKNHFFCKKKHYKIRKEQISRVQPMNDVVADTTYVNDLFESLYEPLGVEIPNEFRAKLQEAMNSLSEKQKDILLRYANEGCLNSKQHLSDSSILELCTIYDTTSDSIKHIKNRALLKIKSICFSA